MALKLAKGANAVVLSAAVLVSLALLYGILDRRVVRWDFTANREFTFSEETRNVLKDLPRPVEITAFFRQGGDPEDLFIRRKVDDILKQYQARSPQIRYRMVDPDQAIELTLRHQVTLDGTAVFVSGEQRKEIYKSQLFDYSRMTDGTLPEFVGESLFTNALLKITQERPSVVCALEGYGGRSLAGPEPEALAEAKNYLVKNNYEVRPVSFVDHQTIPSECTLLLIAAAARAIEGEPDTRIKNYLGKGGRLFLLTEPMAPVGLGRTLELLNIRFRNDLVLDPGRHFLLGPHYPAPTLEEHEITRPLRKFTPVLGTARSLILARESEGVSPLLTTSDESWGETDFSGSAEPKFDRGRDAGGPLTLAAVAARGETPWAVVVGDADFASNGLIEAPGNLDLFLNLVAWLAGDEERIAIGPKTPEFRTLTITPARARVIGLVSQVGYPLLILGGGGWYWFRRRRR